MADYDSAHAPSIDEGLETLSATLAELLAAHGCANVSDPRAILDTLGIGELLRRCEVAERIVRTADTYHPVAEFFVEGSEERRFIVEALQARR
ncbi:hypothetical protein Afer_1042 [Acidimicrobium ferrooxidans DSM 10331]|uniref:Uncharacterized protein n=1 Tax=Acidimicrobium ferrooxidans (strain DSM 10331 / JCM 15462 / NBRC 103882 / ICP) TaxID=525909 RepID=C7LZ22_ACIFD|nr:hypothetical protein [Acidimicrobium ferrooxidans]ACU53980.1 hypothetical protein Afer_1042 [Acidimicrobium ferrooxidans DSM 10331]